ncbi:glycosyl transferase [Ralstonia pickettii]|uniref:Glycosyl transferase n=1 Tax=Ralstonia pickettii TaxID=329 RepID=A0A2N4TWW4_RALPI|nr:glycosyltransferase [Ralstonia pickettii]PLC44192.1 glycosyl transferase [Ralstonia pickettii]
MVNISVGFIVSFFVTMLIVRYSHFHAKFSADTDLEGAQKFHSRAVPRIGGLGLAIAMIVGAIALKFSAAPQFHEYVLLLIASIPAFFGGLVEDLTKNVSPRIRLIATMASALLAIWLLDARIVRVDIFYIDKLFSIYLISLLITAVAVAGLANAVNIIDGFNGLAAIVATMMLLSISYVAFRNNDGFIMSAALLLAGGLLGFFIWNFPAGLIFLGDGGAYLVGFVIAELAVLLVKRNPGVSAWYPVLMLIYPLFETIFSIYRKKFLRGISPGIPDGIHLHMLVYKRLMRWAVGSKEDRHRLRRNSFTSPYLWLLSLLAVLPATLFWRNPIALIFFSFAFVFTYVWLYWSIVRFQSPRWMIVRKKK